MNSRMDFVSKRFLSFYLGFWLVSLFFCMINILNLREISSTTYIIVTIHLMSFVFGFCIVRLKKASSLVLPETNFVETIERLSSNIYFIIFTSILLVYVVSLFVKFWGIIALSNGLAELRADFFDEDMNIYGNSFKPINQWILKPFSYVGTLLFAVLCIHKRNLSCYLLGAFLIIYESLSGGRFGYVRIALIFVFVLFCVFQERNRRKLRWKNAFLYLIVAFLLYELIMLVTVARVGDKDFASVKDVQKQGAELMVETVALSLTQPVISFDYALENNYLQRVGGYQLGFLTLTSLQRFVNPFLNKVGLGSEINTKKIDFKQKEYIDIGYERPQNALYTSLLWYYLDLGLIGVVIFPFIIGLIIKKIIQSLYRFKSVALLLILSVVFFYSLFSLFDFWLTSESDLLMLVLLFIAGSAPKRRSSKIYLYLYFGIACLFTLI